MAVDSKIPEIAVLRKRVEEIFGSTPKVHSSFVDMREEIFRKTKEHVSETTLERLWEYSTRGYSSVSLRTLDVLCLYIGSQSWEVFINRLKEENPSESDMFDTESVVSNDLLPGDRLKIGWQPDRVCIIRYLGDNRFEAEETCNSKMQPGDIFLCFRFQIHTPAYLENLTDSSGVLKGHRYGIALRHGLSMLQKIK